MLVVGLVSLALGCQRPSPTEDGAIEPAPAGAGARSKGVAAAELGVTAEAGLESGQAGVDPDRAAAGEVELAEQVWTLPANYLRFDGACELGERVTLAFGGDLLLHEELQRQAYAANSGARVLWTNIADLLEDPDLTYLNLEGPMARGLDRDFLEVPDPGKVYDKLVYTAYPRFNYHASIAHDIAKAGVDIVSTANNHALDRGSVGVVHTIEALRKAKVDWVGTRESGELERLYTVTKVEGLSIAWVACTNNTNRIPDELDQVLQCGSGTAVEQVIRRLRATGRYSKRKPKVDAVIVTPHWGKEYVHFPREREQKLAQRWVDAGALAVVGSHPHVVQPWAKLEGEAGNEGLVFYSLGNFASHQPELSRRSSLLLYVDLVRVEGSGEVHIAGVRYVPLHVRQAGDEFFVEAIDRVSSPAEGRALLVALLGSANLALPDEDKRGDPHCDPNWRPHEVPGWAELPEPFVVPGTEVAELEGETEGDVVSG